MKQIAFSLAALALAAPAFAQDEPDSRSSSEAVAQIETPTPSPNEIVAAAPASDWVQIPAEDLLVMTLAPDSDGNPREVIIQLMPAPFSQGWVHNIKLLARSGWYDNISVNRVQDNYVVQWGDPNYDNPEATGEAKPLPQGLKVMGEEEYIAKLSATVSPFLWFKNHRVGYDDYGTSGVIQLRPVARAANFFDPYSLIVTFSAGFPIGTQFTPNSPPEFGWPVHCYGMVGVGRSYSPDTGSGAELYTVIGHAPRHLDRNIALVGRIIEGMEHLSSLPRGKGELGFYAADEVDKRTPILSIVVADEVHSPPVFEYLSTESESFARYAEARANRRDPFFIVPAGGADICNIPVPVRRVAAE